MLCGAGGRPSYLRQGAPGLASPAAAVAAAAATCCPSPPSPPLLILSSCPSCLQLSMSSAQPGTGLQPADGAPQPQPQQGGTAAPTAIPPTVPLDTKVPVEQLMGAVDAIRQHHEAEVAAHRQQEAEAAAAGGDASAAAPAAAAACGAGGCEGSSAEGSAGGCEGSSAEGSADGKPLGYPGTVRVLLLCFCACQAGHTFGAGRAHLELDVCASTQPTGLPAWSVLSETDHHRPVGLE